MCAIYLALSRRRREKRIPAVKTVTKDFAEQNRTPSIEPLEKRKRSLLFEREAQRERERKDDDDADFVNPADFKNDDYSDDDEKNERGWWSSK